MEAELPLLALSSLRLVEDNCLFPVEVFVLKVDPVSQEYVVLMPAQRVCSTPQIFLGFRAATRFAPASPFFTH